MESYVLKYKGFTTTVHYSDPDCVWHGKIENIDDLVSFESESLEDIESEFHAAVDEYIDFINS